MTVSADQRQQAANILQKCSAEEDFPRGYYQKVVERLDDDAVQQILDRAEAAMQASGDVTSDADSIRDIALPPLPPLPRDEPPPVPQQETSPSGEDSIDANV